MALRLPCLLAGVSFLSLFGASDQGAAQPAQPNQIAGAPLVMASSRSCDGIRDLMIDTVVHQTVAGGYNPYYYNHYRHRPRKTVGGGGGRGRAPTRSVAPAAPPAEPTIDVASTRSGGGYAEPSGPSHYTTTNVQERGVDEADIVKTDGKHVYVLHANELVIAKTWPVAQTDVAARVTFKTIQPQQLYLRGNQVIVQGYATEALTGWNQGRVRVMVVDVTNRREPRILRIADVEGSTMNSRIVGDDLYLVQQSGLQIPQKLYQRAQETMANIPRADGHTLRPWEVQARLASALRRTLLATFSARDAEAALPRVRIGGVTKQMACADVHMPPNTTHLQMTTLAKLSLDDAQTDLVGALVAGGQIYASTSGLYVAAPFYNWNPQTGAAEYATQVHQFSLGDNRTRPAYVASGKVPGSVLNQFSMSEWRGDLRIATTDHDWSGQQGANNLFVMRPYGKHLAVIGSLRGMGKGERIYSGRMVGDKGYLVTFRQTDPLYTLDLRDPTNPRVAGELKINGFSSYIHPIGDDLLLTIGQDADANGRVQGVHLQVFDVSNPRNPTRRFHEKLGAGSNSQAQYDHKAFMYDAVTGTFAFPISRYDGGYHVNGLEVYHFDKKRGFKHKGRIDHGALTQLWVEAECQKQRAAAPNQPAHNFYYCNPQYRNQTRSQYPITRSMVVDKYILSLSNIGLEIHELGDLDVAAMLSWAKVQKTAALAR